MVATTAPGDGLTYRTLRRPAWRFRVRHVPPWRLAEAAGCIALAVTAGEAYAGGEWWPVVLLSCQVAVAGLLGGVAVALLRGQIEAQWRRWQAEQVVREWSASAYRQRAVEADLARARRLYDRRFGPGGWWN